MKTRIRVLSAVLLCILTLTFLPSCSADNTAPVMTYGSAEISEAMYTYWMAAYKSYYLNYVLGIDDTREALDTDFETVDKNGTAVTKTVAEALTEQITDVIETHCVSLALFDSLKLTLPKDVKNSVDLMISSEIENAGSRKALNESLAPLGINVNILREIYLAEQKVDYLYEYLYGNTELGTTGAEPISAERYQAFYEENYVCVKHIYIRTKDKNVTDADGNVQYDANGYVLTEELTEAESAAQYALIDEILAKLEAGEDFDALMQEYSADAGRTAFPDGYILCENSPMPAEFIDAAFQMKVGETSLLDASYAAHIMRRTELPEAGWKLDAYTDMMSNFTERLKSEVFAEKVAPMIAEIERDEDLIAKHSIYDVPTTVY